MANIVHCIFACSRAFILDTFPYVFLGHTHPIFTAQCKNMGWKNYNQEAEEKMAALYQDACAIVVLSARFVALAASLT